MFRILTVFQRLLLLSSIAILIISVYLNRLNNQSEQDSKEYAENIGSRIESYFQSIDRIVSDLDQQKILEPEFSFLKSNIPQNILIYNKDQLVYWNDHHYIPQFYEVNKADPYYYFENTSGKYLVKEWKINDSINVYGIIEIYRDYPISNDYLTSDYNPQFINKRDEVNIGGLEEDGTKVSLNGHSVFTVKIIKLGVNSEFLGYFSMVLVFISIALLLTFIWQRLHIHTMDGKFEASLLIWIASIFIVRYFMLITEFPDNILETGLFGSMFFASSRINPSLGDMVLNSFGLLLIAAFIFSYYPKSLVLRKGLRAGFFPRFLLGLFISIVYYFAVWYPHVVVQTIYHNSQVTLDVTESNLLSYVRVVSFTIFILSGAVLLLILHVANRVLYQFYRNNYFLFFLITLLGGVIFSYYQYLTSQHFEVAFIAGFIFINLLFHLKIFLQLSRLRYTALQYIFSVMGLISLLGAYGIFEFEKEREDINMARFADHFLIRNDNLTEFYLNEANELLKQDVFISTRFNSPFLPKEVIAQKIRQVYLYSFFDQYDIKITLLNKDKSEVVGSLSPEERELLQKPESFEPYRTDYEGVYFLNKAGRNIVRRYIDLIEITRRGEVAGFIVLDLRLKKIIPNDVYFELLIDNRFIQPFLGRNYSYAVYSENELIYNSGEYDYPKNMKSGLSQDDGYFHKYLKDNQGRIITVSNEKYSIWRVFTNFSALFIIQIFILLILALSYSGFLYYRNITLNFSTRIQIFFNVALFVPMVIVSTITLSSINNSFKEEVNKEHQQKAQTITQNITEKLSRYVVGDINREEMTNTVSDVSKYADADVNIFSTTGELLSTSKSLIYDNDLLSKFINPSAYIQIIEKGQPRWVVEEKVGSLYYKSAYRAVRSYQTGELIGVVSVPFFESEVQLEQQQIEVLSTIINIFTFVFIAFLVLSYFVSRSLTFPLRLITRRLGKTTLTGVNEPIKWESDDEIGLMVSEYNTMLGNLEENKKQLSKKEKESAWREIAQQVAHEIKNPLTPMKLTLQHLERSLSKEDARKPVKTMLHHIETLNDIATSFSLFAKMPIPENEPFELIEIIKKTVRLHENLDNVSIKTQCDKEHITVIGDQKLMGRILSNIVLNAAQSIDEDKGQLNISIEVIEKPAKVVISITDNGMGIEDSIGNKIFVPNFTTKEKGSGLGLAIAKHGIEHAGGKIWFESEVGKGSIFYIELMKYVQ